MTKANDDFSAAFGRLLYEVGIAEAMEVLTGMFVSVVVDYIKHNGEDANKSITIRGATPIGVGNRCDITIHPPKTAQCQSCVSLSLEENEND